MSNALQTTQNNEIQTKDLFGTKDIEILRKSKFKGFEDHEIAYCARICSHLQLNPMLNQIHFVKRKDHKTGSFTIATQVGIDGFRLSAQRAGGYAGSDDATFDDEKHPTKATVTVYRMVNGVKCSFTASARWDEYYPGDAQGMMWKKMPNTMLAKCAEALALRKAFPAELSGVRTDEEMMQSDAEVETKASALNKRAPMKDISEGAIETESKPVPPPPVNPERELLALRVFPFWPGYEGKTYAEIGHKKLMAAAEHIQKQKNPAPEMVKEVEFIFEYMKELGGEV